MDQMVNQAAKIHYMSGGKWKVPMVLRTTLGATRRSAAQHSQSLHAWFCHIPGLKVVMPSTPYDAKGLLKSAIRDDNPVVFFEDKMMYKLKGPVPEEEYTIPLGRRRRQARGRRHHHRRDQQHGAGGAGRGEAARRVGVSAEVVDPRTLWPLDEKTLIESVKKTSRVIVVDEGYGRYGVTAEIAVGDRRRRVLRSGCAGEADGRDARADSVLAAARRRDGADRAARCARQPCAPVREIESIAAYWRNFVALKTYGTMAVDWEQRIDFDRLRRSAWRAPRRCWRSRRWARCSAST